MSKTRKYEINKYEKVSARIKTASIQSKRARKKSHRNALLFEIRDAKSKNAISIDPKTRFPNIETRSRKVSLSLYTSTDLSRFESTEIKKYRRSNVDFSTDVSDLGFDRATYRLFSRSFFRYRRFSDRATFRSQKMRICQNVFLDCVS